MSEEKLVPKLRFECSLEEYKKYKLGELVENVVAGATPKTSVDDYWNGGDIPWLSSGEVHKKFIYFTDKFITSEGYNNSSTKIVPTNSVLIALAGQGKTRGTVAINKIELCTNQSIASIIPNEMLNYKYLFYYLESKYEYLRALSSSDGGRGGLNLKLIRSIPIQVPSIKEQENISNFINEIDKKILLLEQKHKLYDDFKKYLMQQIFTQKLRFKDTENNLYPNWEFLHLKDIITLNGGYAFKSELFKDEGIPIIRISNISQDNSVVANDLVYYDKLKNDHKFIIKKGELIIAMSGATTGKVAVYDFEQISYINQRVGLFKQISNKLYYPFLIQYSLSNSFKKELQKTLVAGAQPNISKKEIEEFKIDLPYYEEQKKIADLLHNIDLKINSIKKQTFEISEFKKGLLQQMFV